MDDFNTWVNKQLGKNGWSYSELARRSEISTSAISAVMAGQRNPGLDLCKGFAKAFGESPEKVLRLAGLLPPIPPVQEYENEIRDLIRALPPDRVEPALLMLKGLANETGRRDSGARLSAQNRAALEEKMESRLIGDTILKMDDPLRICYEVLVDLMSPEQMTTFIERLIQKAAAINSSAGGNTPDVNVQELAGEIRDDRPIPALSSGNPIAAMPDEK